MHPVQATIKQYFSLAWLRLFTSTPKRVCRILTWAKGLFLPLGFPSSNKGTIYLSSKPFSLNTKLLRCEMIYLWDKFLFYLVNFFLREGRINKAIFSLGLILIQGKQPRMQLKSCCCCFDHRYGVMALAIIHGLISFAAFVFGLVDFM